MTAPTPFDGDLMLYPTMDGGDVILRGGQPNMDDGLSTAAYISLFGGDYWGNSIAPDNSHKLTGNVQKVMDGKFKGPQTLLDLQAAAQTDLQWMLDDGVASSVTAVATLPLPNQALLVVTITQPGSGVQALKYAINWTNQGAQVSQLWY